MLELRLAESSVLIDSLEVGMHGVVHVSVDYALLVEERLLGQHGPLNPRVIFN